MRWQPVTQVQFSGGSIDSITYLTGDQIGSPRLGTNQSQDIVWRWDSDAFGSVEPATDPDGDGSHVNVENRFAGQYADGESGLRYNWHRYYDAGKGRYVSSDPIGLAGGVNGFGYVGGNPVNWVDPTGEAVLVTVLVVVIIADFALYAADFLINRNETKEKIDKGNNEVFDMMMQDRYYNYSNSCPDPQETQNQTFNSLTKTAKSATNLPGTFSGGLPASKVDQIIHGSGRVMSNAQ